MTEKCSKVMDLKPINKDGALLYLKLREDGCTRPDAARCAARVRCRSDISKQTDGLISKDFDLRYPTKPLDRTTKSINNGWISGNLSLSLGQDYDPYFEEKESEFSNLHKIETHLIKFQLKKQKKFKGLMSNFKNFFAEEGTKRLAGLKGEELLKEVNTIRGLIKPREHEEADRSHLPFSQGSLNTITLAQNIVKRQTNLAVKTPTMLGSNPLDISTFTDLENQREKESKAEPSKSGRLKHGALGKQFLSFKNVKTRKMDSALLEDKIPENSTEHVNDKDHVEELRNLKEKYLSQAKKLSNSNMNKEASKLLNVCDD